ncbi:hypothetical protein HMPREF1544_07692 [Mucor circinelloides 1006PhL]|uniref:UDP-glycosyltransferases domain-containing protein n=1 Tax=Mucor circinelloides f. circinelloides (strain 1006PhL) TaxID=1220926 RepID=S2J782_MUCC1|nr:hypothetical protein HMPREF1544_07692 [Mucor circinelloides 1006PhL]
MLLSAAVSFALTAGLVVCSHLDTATSDPAYYYLDEQDVTFDRQPKNIVIATSIGGSSHAKWVLEIGKVLADRGHNLTYVTRDDHLHLVDSYPEIKAVSAGRAIYPTTIVDDVLYKPFYDIAKMVRKLLNSAYTEEMRFYRQGLHITPDFFICDAFDDPCIDTAVQFKTPFAITCTGILHQDISVPYMNGLGTTEHATSENMTLWQRFHHKYIDFVKTLYYLYPELKELDTLRQQFGISPLGLNRFKQWDNALKLINSYFGFTPSQVLGPLTHMVGPIMTSKQKPLSREEQAFLDSHSRIAYVAFGQYAVPLKHEIELLMSSLLDQVERKQLDGIIWVGLKEQVAKYESQNPNTVWKFTTTASTFDLPAPLFDNNLSQDVFMPSWANQFSVLGHPSTALFVSHGGATSANEATFHGVPLLVHPYIGDQRLVGRALSVAGVARVHDRDGCTFDLLKSQLDELLFDADGYVARNLTRMKILAQFGHRRKSYAADLIEEHMFVAENGISSHRYESSRNMPKLKAMDIDLHFTVIAFIIVTGITFHYMINTFS